MNSSLPPFQRLRYPEFVVMPKLGQQLLQAWNKNPLQTVVPTVPKSTITSSNHSLPYSPVKPNYQSRLEGGWGEKENTSPRVKDRKERVSL